MLLKTQITTPSMPPHHRVLNVILKQFTGPFDTGQPSRVDRLLRSIAIYSASGAGPRESELLSAYTVYPQCLLMHEP